MAESQQTEQSVELPEQMFPDLTALEVFLEEAERHALQCGVSQENAQRFVEFLRTKYAKGLPEYRWQKK